MPGQRKLMQADEDKEEFSYEDIKEVLKDDEQDRDDMDREMERIKRDEVSFLFISFLYNLELMLKFSIDYILKYQYIFLNILSCRK